MDWLFWVFDAKGDYVVSYPRKGAAVQHAARIGGTWHKHRR